MFCHRLLRPIAGTRTVAEGTDRSTVIDRAGGAAGRSPLGAPYVWLIVAAQPRISAT
jgi:hypothetical protein